MSCSLWKETGCEDFPSISSWKETIYVRSHCSCSMAGFERAFSLERDSGWEQLPLASLAGRDLVPSGLDWVETLWQGSAAAGAGPEQSEREREILLGRAASLGSRGGLTQSLPVSGVLNQVRLHGWRLWAPRAGGISLGTDLVAGICNKGFVWLCVCWLFVYIVWRWFVSHLEYVWFSLAAVTVFNILVCI